MKKEYEENKFKRIKKLGEGSFGEAFLVENHETNEFLVCKEMKLNSLAVS